MSHHNPNRSAEVSEKLGRLRNRLAARGLDGVTLNHTYNTAWLTAGGATYVNEATDGGVATLIVTHDGAYAVTNSIEEPRMRTEEHLADLGFEFRVSTWHRSEDPAAALTRGKKIATEAEFEADLRDLRTHLTPGELERFRGVGKMAAHSMNQAIMQVRPGDTEYQIAGYLAGAVRSTGGSPIVVLIATDARIHQYRHPLPADKTLEKYAMLVLCLRYQGLVASITRLVHFGPIAPDLAAKIDAVAVIDAEMIAATQAGKTLGDVFAIAKHGYAQHGHPNAIDEHHQGGSAGYKPREILAVEGDKTAIDVGQAFAWNPSISGAKSEDTVLLTGSAQQPEVITAIEGWPTKIVNAAGYQIARPLVMER
jgi:antitoxin VapB